eukprot:GHVU01101955.1.p4 GENE.GHVU01101955.1~~GHVU01101955.1.p4  ORF type:complete len:100 (+),score=5.09 GHVU01101955.1:1402-1701(+)
MNKIRSSIACPPGFFFLLLFVLLWEAGSATEAAYRPRTSRAPAADIIQALESINTEGMPIREAAEAHTLPRSTLHQHVDPSKHPPPQPCRRSTAANICG